MAKGRGISDPISGFLGRPKRARWEAYANLVPVQNARVQAVHGKGSALVLHVPLNDAMPWLPRWLFRRTQENLTKQIELDNVGRFVWELIDGRRSLEAIRAELMREFKMRPVESQVALAQFMDSLFARNLIATRTG